jgi:hypothetical protein
MSRSNFDNSNSVNEKNILDYYYGTNQQEGPNVASLLTADQYDIGDMERRNMGLLPLMQGAYGQQGNLVNDLLRTANGQGPSVANTQLQQGLGDINRNAMSQAAGATGAGGVLARYGAMIGGANAAAQTNQAAAIQRAQEIAQARAQAANVLAQQQQNTSALYGTNVKGIADMSGQDLKAEGNLQDENEKAQTDKNSSTSVGNFNQSMGSMFMGG